MEKIQRDVAHNHRLVPGPELEEKALVLKQLGETLTELKGEPALARVTLRGSLLCPGSSACLPSQLTPSALSAHFPGLQSKMRVVLRVEVEAVKFLKEEPQRLDGLLKRCRGVTDTLAQIRRSLSPPSLVSRGVIHWAQTPYPDSSEITACQLDLPFNSDFMTHACKKPWLSLTCLSRLSHLS